jgi:hypothetical protein
MLRKVIYNETIIEYNLECKNVKNVNLRINTDLSVNVSANKRVNLKFIDDFVVSKGHFILKAQEKLKNNTTTELVPKYTNEEFVRFVLETFDEVYIKFKGENINKPQLKFKNMKSRWGSCNFSKGIITLSTNLIYCTKEQIYYVIVHEFSHLLVPNHSKDFYAVVSKYCSDYKRIRKEMNKIII